MDIEYAPLFTAAQRRKTRVDLLDDAVLVDIRHNVLKQAQLGENYIGLLDRDTLDRRFTRGIICIYDKSNERSSQEFP